MIDCRVCGSDVGGPLLSMRGMPATAQDFPSNEVESVETSQELSVYQCGKCGLTQLGGEPVPYYREVIRSIAFSNEMAQFRRRQISAFVSDHDLSGKRVLEVGCGKGEYLNLLRDAGANASGTEFSAENAAMARQNGHVVHQLFPDNANEPIPGLPYSAFFSFNFMEHWPDPRSVLTTIGEALDARAVGLVEVPNFDMLLEKQVATEFVADHLSYFTADSLRTLMSLSGFEVLEIKEVWYRYILSATVRRRDRVSLEPMRRAVDLQRERVNKFIESAGPRGVAVWGAGHQALAAMALMQLKGRIRYVVDSAPFKQGKLTPATYIPIMAPTVLDSDPVDSIIVMAAGFSDEVVSIIRARWGSLFRLAIMREDTVEVLD